MLILLGGFLGSGRKRLARQLAKTYGFHLYDTEAKKTHRSVFQEDGSVKDVVQRPRTNELRSLLYKTILDNLPVESKMYPDTIIEDSFHLKEPREFLIKEAAKYFAPIVFVWIDSDETHVEERLRRIVERGLIANVEEGHRRRRGAIHQFDGLNPGSHVFKCVRGDQAEVDALWALIQTASSKRIA